MGQKVHPFGFRVGITEAHKSRWFAPKALFGELLVEDYKIRKYVDKRLNRTPPFAAVSDILIERTREELTIIIRTARPGQVVGPKGQDVEKLTADPARGKGSWRFAPPLVLLSGATPGKFYHSHPHVPSEFDELDFDMASQVRANLTTIRKIGANVGDHASELPLYK